MRCRTAGRGVAAFLSLACLAAEGRAQTTWYVDDDASPGGDGTTWSTAYDSPSTALAAAQSGDQIWVAAGTYVGNFTLALGVEVYGGFAGTETELSQRDWTADPTILDGDENGSVVTAPSGATATTRIDGFTIRNGSGTIVDSYTYGGGLYLYDSSPTITNNTITGNVADRGGGLRMYRSSPTIANNTITGNGAGRHGGGLYLLYSSPMIASNTITANSANDGSGGGLYLSDSSPTIANNTIMGNSARGYYDRGGGLFLVDSSPTIANNTITGNSADAGGGLYLYSLWGSCLPTIVNNAITGNGANYGGGLYLDFASPTIANNAIRGNGASYGGGLYLYRSSPTIANNTLTGNGAGDGGGLYLDSSSPTIANTIVAFNSSGVYRDDTSSSPTLRYNCVYGNTEYDYDGLTDPTGTDGNISADPRLADLRYGNVHIQPDSPCVGAGSNANVANDVDMDGQPRIHPLGGTVDIGADESDGTVWPPGPYIVVRVSPVGDDANDGSSWPLAKRTVQAGIDAASALGGEVWVRAGTYYERVTLRPYAYLYGGFAGGEITRDERDWAANVTTLDGQQQGSVVTARAGHRVGAVDGFTITNGRASDGGGLYLRSSSPTIANNTTMGNSADDDGGGVYLESSFATITSNTITGNGARDGGGLYLDSSSPTIVGNTIAGNSAYLGGGLYLRDSSATMANTIVAFNSSGIYRYDTSSSPALRYNCVYGNTEYDYSGLTDLTGTDGNISADPQLADPRYAHVHIQPDSPCVDAGNNADAAGNFDIDGEPRIQPIAGTVDIGADESDGTAWPAWPYVVVRVSPAGDDANDGSSWGLAKRTVQAAIDAASALGGEVWVQRATYYGCITLHPYAYLYGGFAGVETTRDERDWAANITILDGQRQGSVVTARAGYGVSAIDGFTITNGNAEYGGGLYLNGSSPTIANNTITGNSAESGGGGLHLDSSSPTMANNTITGNSAKHGNALCLLRSSPTITNNTITGNSPGHVGSGLYLLFSSPTIANTIIAFNSSGVYRFGTAPSPTLRYNCVYGNTAYDYDGLTDPTGTDGNISADPRLADRRYGNVHIQPDSPCVDAGSNADVANDVDTDGEPRIQPIGGTVDIGADESDGTVWPAGPYVVVRVSPAGDDANEGSSWGLAKRSVQAAIDAASVSGGEVWVQSGTYYECITLHPYAYLYGGFAGGETARDQRDWVANVTTLHRQQQGSVVTAHAGCGVSAVDGFTITGGGLYLRFSSPTIANNTITGNSVRAAYGGGGLYLYYSSPTITNNTIAGNNATYGGGLSLYYSSPTITNNTITGNGADDRGGGLYLSNSSPTIANNTIAGNGADNGGGGLYLSSSSPTIANNIITGNDADDDGGGLYLRYDSSPTIANNTIMGNSARGIYDRGGGLYLSSSSPTITNNTITDNSAGEGGGLYLSSCSPTITNNTITSNSADLRGGGLYLESSLPTITSNTITGNGAQYGGGLYLRDASPTIANNTITGNGAQYGGGLYLRDASPTIANTIVAFNSSGVYRYDTSSSPTLRYNCVYGNTEYDYHGLTDPTGTDGNISADPRLADPRYGNVHIQPDSPCVDAGNNADTAGDFDMDGEARIQPISGTVDIGADESDGTVWPVGPYVVVRVSPAGDDADDGSSWGLAKRTVQAGIDAASGLGGEVWVQGGTYYERVTLRAYAYLYGGFAGVETTRDERDWAANVTTLDGQQEGSVVTVRAGYGVGAVDGFTITGGSALRGGGLDLVYSSPTIANNTIMGNGASSGGGLYLLCSSPTIANNTITSNSADYRGGGLYVRHSSPTIANNTITGNSATDGGGGLHLRGDSSPTIANTIVAFNSSGVYRYDTSSSPTLRYNCVYGNTEYDYSGLTDPTGTDGNISADPLFAQTPDAGPDGLWGTSDDLGDLQLSSGSPCIDAADNDSVPPDTPDLDGDGDTAEPLPLDLAGGPRFLDDPQTPDTGDPGATGFPVVDMGAYEFASSCGNGLVDPGEDCDDGFADDCGTCNADCTGPGIGSICGDGELCPEFEECDDAGESAECDADCTVAECGDGTLNVTAGEDCDPPGSDCCDASCYFEPSGTACGDPSDTECDNPDTCDGAGICLANHAPHTTPCDDGELCNGVEACDGDGTCVSEVMEDCNGNAVEDSCDIEDGTSRDCNDNTIPDECDIAAGTSADENGNGIPDECEMAEGVYLDIKPGGCPNPVNPRSKGVVPVAIVGSESFDVAQIDTDTLALRRSDGVGVVVTPLSGPPRPGITTDDVATPFAGDLCDCHGLGGDGIDDLLLKFSTPELTVAFELDELPGGASVVLTLSGSLLDGTAFEASDCVVIPGKPARARPHGLRRRK